MRHRDNTRDHHTQFNGKKQSDLINANDVHIRFGSLRDNSSFSLITWHANVYTYATHKSQRKYPHHPMIVWKIGCIPKVSVAKYKKIENTLTQGLMTCKRFEWIRCLGSLRYQLIIIICYGNMSLNQRFNCSACINTHEIFKVFQVFKALTLFSNHRIRLNFIQ